MLFDSPKIVENTAIGNATVSSGSAFPSSPNVGEIFYLSSPISSSVPAGIYSYGTTWDNVSIEGFNLVTHINDNTIHVTSAEKALLDGITATATELNYSHGLTSAIQTQLNSITNLDVTQNNRLSNVETSVNTTIPNQISSINSQISTIQSTDTSQNNRLTSLENSTSASDALTAHENDMTVHLTTAENTLLDNIVAGGLSSADLLMVGGAASLSSSIPVLLANLQTNKLNTSGGTLTGNLTLSGSRILGLQDPVASNEPATKNYVDSFVQGLHWAGSVKAASVGNLVLSGTQTADGVALAVNDRVLVLNQNDSTTNGIYLVANGAWSRSTDFMTSSEISNSAVFVLGGGTTQGKSTWIQTTLNPVVGTDPIQFTAFSGPIVNSAGNGISLGANGAVAVKGGGGITFDANSNVTLNLYSTGGLMLTTDGDTAITSVNTSAQLALSNSGVSAGTYNSSTTISSFTIDKKGRITSTGTATPIAPAWTNISSKPTTVSGFGITDAVVIGGSSMTGDLLFGAAGAMRSVSPVSSTAWFSTNAYGTSQGDNKTHFGFYNGTTYVNYIRGVSTEIPGTISALSAVTIGAVATTGNLVLSPTATTTAAGSIVFAIGATTKGTISASTSAMTYTSTNAQHTFTGSISSSGTITASGDISAYSDRRLKTDIKPIENALDKTLKLNGVTYRRIDDDTVGTGLIAQDVQAVLPEAITVAAFDGTLSLAYGNLVGLLVEAIKELNTRIKVLEDEKAAK